jgi:DNA-binding beta-propeller fold protein YncE
MLIAQQSPVSFCTLYELICLDIISTFGSVDIASPYASLKVIHSTFVEEGLYGCSMTSSGQVLVSSRKIILMDVNGRVITSMRFGNSLFGLGIDPKDQVFLCDTDNNRIQVFDQNYKLLQFIPVTKPIGIAITNERIIISGGAHSHIVTVLDKSGTLQHAFGGNGDKDGEFEYPRGLAVASNGNILVIGLTSDNFLKILLLQTLSIIVFKYLIQMASSYSSLEKMDLEMETWINLLGCALIWRTTYNRGRQQ